MTPTTPNPQDIDDDIDHQNIDDWVDPAIPVLCTNQKYDDVDIQTKCDDLADTLLQMKLDLDIQ